MTDERGFVFHGPDGQVELSIDEVRGLAKNNDPDGLYALSMAYLFGWDVEQNEDVGYDLLEKAVAAGQTEAMALMVRLFMQGDYSGIDSEKAAGYAIEAAKDGIPDAQLYAGLAYMDGVSVPQAVPGRPRCSAGPGQGLQDVLHRCQGRERQRHVPGRDMQRVRERHKGGPFGGREVVQDGR